MNVGAWLVRFLEFLGFALCLVPVGEGLMAAIGYAFRDRHAPRPATPTKRRHRKPRAPERPWRNDGRVLGALSAFVVYGPLGVPRDAVVLAGIASAAMVYVVPIPSRRRDGWERGRLMFWTFAIAAMLVAVGVLIRALSAPLVGQLVGGTLVGLWVAFTITEFGAGRSLRARSAAHRAPGWLGSPGARRWLRSSSRLLVVGSVLGLLTAVALWHHHVALPATLDAPVIGLIVGPVALATLVDNRRLTTLAALVRRRGTPPSHAVAELKRAVPVGGVIGAAAGAVAMASPWRWIGVQVLALAVFAWARGLRRFRAARPARPEPMPAAADAEIQKQWLDGRWLTLLVVALVTMLLSIEHTVLNVAVPTVQRSLGASTSQLTWIVDGFILSYAGFLLAFGKLGDRYGRQRALRVGLVVFAASSVACGFAGSPGWLIAGRYAMGLGAAAMLPTTLSTIQAVFPPEKRGRAIVLWSAAYGLGIGLGPVLGGLVVQHFGWRWVFWSLGPIAAILLAATRLVPNSRDTTRARVDIPGAVLSVAWSTSILWAIIEAPSLGWRNHWVTAAFGAGAAILTLFLARQLVARHPLLDLGLLRDRRFSAPAAALSLVYFGLMGTLFVLTTYLQIVRGYPPVSAGLRTLPVSIALIIVSVPAGRLAERWRYGPKIAVALGLSLIAFALLHMAGTTYTSPYTLTFTSLVIAGVGIGMAQAPATSSLMEAVPPDNASVGSASNDTTRLTGGMFGIAVLSSVTATVYSARIATTVALLPAGLAGPAQNRVEAAMAIATRIGGSLGGALGTNAAVAYIDGMDSALRVAAAVVLAGAIATLLFLPARWRSHGRHAQGADFRPFVSAHHPVPSS